MKIKRTAFARVSVAALLATGAAAIAAAVIVDPGSGSPEAQAPRGNFSVAQARSFGDYPLYYAGDNVAGLPLTTVLRQAINQTQETVSFIYGDCIPPPDAGCAPPVEIQIWPACVRNPSLYKGQRFPVPVPTSTRGAPAALFAGGHRLEIQTGISTVVVFGAERSQISTVANELEGVNVQVRPGEKLPAAERAALTGTLTCK